MSLLVICEILGLFLNTLTADDKFSFRISENLRQPIQMILSKKKTFSHFFVAVLRSTSTFVYFEKKDDSHSLFISEGTNCKRLG